MKKKVLILLCVFSCCNLVGCNVDSELLFGSEAQQETEKSTPEAATEASTEYYESLTFRSKLGKRIKDNIEEHSPWETANTEVDKVVVHSSRKNPQNPFSINIDLVYHGGFTFGQEVRIAFNAIKEELSDIDEKAESIHIKTAYFNDASKFIMATTTDFGETWHYVRTTDGITDTEFGLSLDELESFDEVRLDDKTSADSETEADFLNNLPLASYEDIAAGKYTGQDVCVDVVIDKKIDRNYSDGDSCSFSCWIKGNDGYFYSPSYMHDVDDSEASKGFMEAENGDVVRYATTIYSDNSFGTSTILASEIIGKEDLQSVYDTYKSSLNEFDYASAERNPDEYKDKYYKISGRIVQIIDESDYSADYLLSTDQGYIYLTNPDDKEARGARLLENDNVTVYGDFTGLTTYSYLSDKQYIPEFFSAIIELN